MVLATEDDTLPHTFCFPFLANQGPIPNSEQPRVVCGKLTSLLSFLPLTLGYSQAREEDKGVAAELLLI